MTPIVPLTADVIVPYDTLFDMFFAPVDPDYPGSFILASCCFVGRDVI